MPETLLELDDLHVAYGPVRALKGISLTVAGGEVVALLGANGAGKSTTLRAISGLVRPRRGTIRFGGVDLTALRPADIVRIGISGLVRPRRGTIRFGGVDLTALRPADIVRVGISHCPEGRRVFASLTVADNIRMGSVARTMGDAAADRDALLALFPILKQRWRQTAGTLSGGEQQQLALVRALMAAPRLLLLDEPSLGIAPLLVNTIFRALADLKARNITMLLVEQNAGQALGLADRAYVLRTGTVALAGTIAELKQGDRLAQAYLGSMQAAV